MVLGTGSEQSTFIRLICPQGEPAWHAAGGTAPDKADGLF
jgi:hypothetical protein